MYIRVESKIVEIEVKRSSNGSYGALNIKKRRYNDPQINYNQNQSDLGQISRLCGISFSISLTIFSTHFFIFLFTYRSLVIILGN